VYRFSGKEFDEETGLSYFGARYYNPKWSVWLGVDPEYSKFPNWSPYNYCMQNPINLVDPDGLKPIPSSQLIARLKAVTNLKTFDRAWNNSNHGGNSVNEWGFTVTISSNKKWFIGRNLHTDHKGGSVSRDSNVPKSETIIGFVHTHPYSSSEGSHLGAGFSGSDLANLSDHASEGKFFTMVEAGNKRYAAIISDPEKAQEFFKKNDRESILKKYNEAFDDPKNSKLSFQKRIDKAIIAVFGDGKKSGVSVYVTDDKSKNNFKKL